MEMLYVKRGLSEHFTLLGRLTGWLPSLHTVQSRGEPTWSTETCQYWIRRARHPRVFLTPSLISRKTAGARKIARWERTWVWCSEPHKNSDEIACICNPSTPKIRQTAEAEQLPISSWASHPDAWHSSRGKRLPLFQGGEWEWAHYGTPAAAQSHATNK